LLFLSLIVSLVAELTSGALKSRRGISAYPPDYVEHHIVGGMQKYPEAKIHIEFLGNVI
jgi:hypothetical protein